jgi:alpha-glucoside transport system substrate-binding protein
MHPRRLLTLASAALIAVAACTPVASTAPSSPPSSPGASTGTPSQAPTGPNAELTAALDGAYDGETIDLVAQWIDAEGTAFSDSLDAFRDATGINVVYSGITNYETVLRVRVEGGLAPDIAQLAQPGRMREYQEAGKLVDLDTVLDGDTVRASYGEGFIADSSVDGKLYGLYYAQNFKSIVWYPNAAFESAGYAPPTTWAELEALVAEIKADGGAPWCTTIEHGDVTGWVATDWLEDVLLRTAPPATYDAWAAHELPFTDPAVANALNIVGTMWFTEGNTYGGAERIAGTWVGDSQTPMFDADGPKCWLHKQAAWIPGFWPAGKVAGVDSSFFYFPAI